MFNWTLCQRMPEGYVDVYVLAPEDMSGEAVLPGEKMVDENGKDVFTVFAASAIPKEAYDIANGHEHIPNGDIPTYQCVCFDEHNVRRFTDECFHYEDRHSYLSWCLNHPDDCGDFDRDAYFANRDEYLKKWKSQ